jgi:multidrug resistance efflux pump
MKITFRPPKSVIPDREHGIRIPYAPAKRAVARWRWYLIVLLVAAPLLYLVGQLFYTLVFVKAAGLVSLQKTPVNSQIAGAVQRIEVRTGDRVVPGQLLAALSSAELEQREMLLRAEFAARQPALAQAAGVAVLQELRKTVQLAQKVADYQAGHLQNVRFLFDQGAATVADLNLAQAQLHQAEISLNQARGAWAARQLEDTRLQTPERENETRIKLIQAELAAVAAQQARLSNISPVRGIVLEVLAQPGQSVAQGDPLLVLGNLDAVSFTAYLEPKYIGYAHAGQAATVQFDDGRRFAAVVREKPEMTSRIPAAITPSIGGREYMLLLTLDPIEPLPPGDLVDNLPVRVRFPFSF